MRACYLIIITVRKSFILMNLQHTIIIIRLVQLCTVGCRGVSGFVINSWSLNRVHGGVGFPPRELYLFSENANDLDTQLAKRGRNTRTYNDPEKKVVA